MDRLVRGAGGVITLDVYNADGILADAPSLPTVTVLDGAGTAVATGPATKTGTGRYEFPLTGAQVPECDLYTAAWASTGMTFTTAFEVIGGWPCSLADIRGQNTDLANTIRYPAALLYAARTAAMEWVEEVTEVAWSTRRARVTLDGDGTDRLVLPHVEVQQLLAVTLDGQAVTGASPLRSGILIAPTGQVWTAGVGNVTVDYTHGVVWCPAKVSEAIAELALGAVIEWGSRLPERATSVSTDVGTFRLTLPGRDGPTGIPRVDAVLAQYGYQRHTVG